METVRERERNSKNMSECCRKSKQTNRESNPAGLPPSNWGYLRLISKESCEVSADNVLMETRQ